MMDHPEMVGGLDLRKICPGKVALRRAQGDPEHGRGIVAKSGASGVYCAGMVGRGLGFACKVDDGGAAPVALVFFSMMRKLRLISPSEYKRFLEQCPLIVKNRCGEVVGHIVVAF
jgi:L-asparaginase II